MAADGRRHAGALPAPASGAAGRHASCAAGRGRCHEQRVPTAAGPVSVRVIRTDEELVIARYVHHAIGLGSAEDG